MAKKLADDLIKTNTEYTKLRANAPKGTTPRENPDHQTPGYRGLNRPDLEQWTTEELKQAARSLNLSDVDARSREELVEHLLNAGQRG